MMKMCQVHLHLKRKQVPDKKIKDACWRLSELFSLSTHTLCRWLGCLWNSNIMWYNHEGNCLENSCWPNDVLKTASTCHVLKKEKLLVYLFLWYKHRPWPCLVLVFGLLGVNINSSLDIFSWDFRWKIEDKERTREKKNRPVQIKHCCLCPCGLWD